MSRKIPSYFLFNFFLHSLSTPDLIWTNDSLFLTKTFSLKNLSEIILNDFLDSLVALDWFGVTILYFSGKKFVKKISLRNLFHSFPSLLCDSWTDLDYWFSIFFKKNCQEKSLRNLFQWFPSLLSDSWTDLHHWFSISW